MVCGARLRKLLQIAAGIGSFDGAGRFPRRTWVVDVVATLDSFGKRYDSRRKGFRHP
jgi:hypothetical protein